MASAGEIDALYESTLKPRLEALEGMRLTLRGYIVKAGLCVGLPFALYFLSDILDGVVSSLGAGLIQVAAFSLIFVGVLVAAFRYLLPGVSAYMNYRTRFKHDVAAEVFKIVCPTADYSPTKGIAETVFDEAGIFNTRGGYVADDRVRGKIGTTAFEACDVTRSYRTSGKNSRTVVVFRGLFFHLDFNKRLTGTTIVQPAGGSPSALGSRTGFSRVALESPAFDEAFEAYATDEVEARYILTPAMMEQILSLAARTGKPIYLGFKGHRAYLGVHYGRALFEPGITSTTSADAIHEMAALFALADGVVDELDLNTRIWTKDADESLLHAPDAATEDTLDRLAASGNVTPELLWETAAKAVGTADDGADAPKPPDTSIEVEHAGGTSVVRYGLSVGFFVALALSIASGAVLVTAAKALPEALGLPALAGWTSWFPAIPYVPDVVTGAPIPFAIVGAVVLLVTMLVWVLRVRRVTVERDAVRIARGLRPWARAYPRPLYGKVIRADKAVYIGKSKGFSLVNVSASPMLSEAEARWVASELRRAMKGTSH